MKKIYKMVAVVAIIAIAGVTAYNAQSDKLQMSVLTIDNIEAIAWGESDSNCINGCLASYGFCHCYEDYFLKEATW